MDEFDLISRYFAPLAKSLGAEGLRNDVAEISRSGRVVATVDALVEGVHFLSDDPIETVAAKLVRVNASDMIAKGALPREALLTLVWPKARPVVQVEAFVEGLKSSLARWGCNLIGGDTTSTDGPLVLSMTMLGECTDRGAVLRSTAQIGDDLWVTGTIGDSWLGLQARLGRLDGMADPDREYVVSRYRVPEPPAREFASVVAEFATASIDVSDGLSSDGQHLAEESGVSIDIVVEDVPLSAEARRWVGVDAENRIVPLMSGGDDYQALFTVAAGRAGELEKATKQVGGAVTRIGSVREGAGVVFKGNAGEAIQIDAGWRHSLGK